MWDVTKEMAVSRSDLVARAFLILDSMSSGRGAA